MRHIIRAIAGSLVIVVAGAVGPAQSQVLTTITAEDEASVFAGYVYKKLDGSAVGDVAGSIVFRSNVVKTTKPTDRVRCIFAVDTSAAGDAVTCDEQTSPGGGTFAQTGAFAVNSSGTVAFDARVKKGPLGVFLKPPAAALEAVTLEGDAVPSGGTVTRVSDTRITDGGLVVFTAALDGVPAAESTAILACAGTCPGGTGLDTLLTTGAPVPDRADREFCTIEEIAASDFGIAFLATTKEDCTNGGEAALRGIFRMGFGLDAETLALQTETSNPPGTTYLAFLGPPAIENDGIVTFRARTKNATNSQGLYLCDPGSCPAAEADLAVAVGDLDDAGKVFKGFGDPAISDAGDIAFRADGSGGACGVYIRRASGDIETVTAKGGAVPGRPAIFQCPETDPAFSSGGAMTFRAVIRTTTKPIKNSQALFHYVD